MIGLILTNKIVIRNSRLLLVSMFYIIIQETWDNKHKDGIYYTWIIWLVKDRVNPQESIEMQIGVCSKQSQVIISRVGRICDASASCSAASMTRAYFWLPYDRQHRLFCRSRKCDVANIVRKDCAMEGETYRRHMSLPCMFSRMNSLIWKILEKMVYNTDDSCYFLMQLMAWSKISIPGI